MQPKSLYPVSERDPATVAKTHATADQYAALYSRSLDDNEAFWAEQAQRLDWMTPFTKVRHVDYGAGSGTDVQIRWFEDGVLNLCVNAVDRHLPERADDVAIIFEGDDPNEAAEITYGALSGHVNRLANGLRQLGVKKGDRVTLYMPMIPEAAYAMLACARIGAVHSIVFGGFSPEALGQRIVGCESDFLITADEGLRGGKAIPLKANADRAIEISGRDVSTLVVRRTGGAVDWHPRDTWYHELVAGQPDACAPEPMNAEDPFFILYTSGSTGKPKGVLHTTGGYGVYAATTHHFVFDYRPGEVFWCTADVGWITGHSYIVYGPLMNGATTLMFEGVPNFPDVSRFWQVIEKHRVNIFYTAPTAIRALMREGDAFVTGADRSSLRLLGSVGEPINPEAWRWYHDVVGEGRCPVVDTWWQTETGGILLSPLPGATDLKPGSATNPFFGIQPVIVDNDGAEIAWAPGQEIEGNLCMKASWPGQMRTVYGDNARFVDTYFSQFPGLYFTGDGCRRDGDGYYWITGRVDDVLNVSGHRMGTAEIESALVLHDQVAEAAVVGYPHDIKGQGIYCYVTLNAGEHPSEALRAELVRHVRTEIGPVATPDLMQFAPGLPKTRSGKIMRRILRKIAEDDFGNLGDTSTLADPSVVDDLIENRANK